MPKLHELLAVQDTTKKQADKCLADLSHTFEKKENHFAKRIVTYTPVAEAGKQETEVQLEIQTTVPKELAWLRGIITKSIDVGYQIDEGNMQARASIEIDGKILAKDVPVTALMRLEHQIDAIFTFAQKIKTLDPSQGFTPDPS